ncbi:MAG: LrgB family protein [Clostridiaceae bacterium]|nr:LrgB family protein [Clostridiaceae bacterium]
MSGIDVFFQTSAYWAVFLTILAYLAAVRLQKKLRTPFCNPIFVAVVFVILILKATGVSNLDYQSGVKSFSYILTPATICLGLPLYEQIKALRQNIWAILVGAITGALVSLIVILLMSHVFHFDRALTISLLPKSITTAMGLPLSEEAGGIGAITTAAIIVTGLIGNLCGQFLCKLFRITHPISQGVAFGTSSHVIGTSKASELGELMGAVGSLSLVVAGLVTAILFPLFL